MLAYSQKMEISRRLHNNFAIIWGILGVTILALLPNTDYSNILKEFYITMVKILGRKVCSLQLQGSINTIYKMAHSNKPQKQCSQFLLSRLLELRRPVSWYLFPFLKDHLVHCVKPEKYAYHVSPYMLYLLGHLWGCFPIYMLCMKSLTSTFQSPNTRTLQIPPEHYPDSFWSLCGHTDMLSRQPIQYNWVKIPL